MYLYVVLTKNYRHYYICSPSKSIFLTNIEKHYVRENHLADANSSLYTHKS